jgi:hypothetical protein
MRALLLFALCLLASGCADIEMKPGSKSMARREIPPGPGLLTGSQGEFVIFRLEGNPTEAAPSSLPSAPAKEGEAAQ